MSGDRLAVTGQTGGALELGLQIEQQQHGAEGGLGGMELFEASMVRTQSVLQPGHAILPIGVPVVVAPDLLRSVLACC
ncbi:MAG: hypothetical protein LC130_33725 [Bryobacterales bacterium]|nr:hypothetical protein [Bryobacterales bacterium]